MSIVNVVYMNRIMACKTLTIEVQHLLTCFYSGYRVMTMVTMSYVWEKNIGKYITLYSYF